MKFGLGDPEQAILDFSKMIQLDPDNANIYNNRGMMRFRFGASEFSRGNADKARELYEAAIEDYTQAIRLNPKDAEAQSNLGAVKSALAAMLKQ
ncbi:tetratricopeptide repeat protein [Candidatus Poribacteria bacterium]|nr:tetratricopeptide repeat protein [Candidatus Poribacteria bacterium]